MHTRHNPMEAAINTALVVAPVSEMAGVGRHVLDLVDTGVPGRRIHVLCPPGPLAQALPPNTVTAGEFGPEFGVRTSTRTVRQVIAEQGASLVHSHLAWADIAVWLSRPKVPHLSTEHGVAGAADQYAGSRVDALVTARVHWARMRRMAATVCVSAATAQVVRQRWRPPKSMPLVVIPNGVDRNESVGESSKGAPTSAPVVGYLGRFAEEKRPQLVIDAFARIKQELPDARLSMAGAGKLLPELQQRVGALRIVDAVEFPGWVDAATWLAGIDVLCVSSIWENCSYAILEALASGVGVVAADVGGNPELLPTEALVDPEDEGAFAAAVVKQLKDPANIPRLPDDYPTRAQMAARLGEVYDQVSVRN